MHCGFLLKISSILVDQVDKASPSVHDKYKELYATDIDLSLIKDALQGCKKDQNPSH